MLATQSGPYGEPWDRILLPRLPTGYQSNPDCREARAMLPMTRTWWLHRYYKDDQSKWCNLRFQHWLRNSLALSLVICTILSKILLLYLFIHFRNIALLKPNYRLGITLRKGGFVLVFTYGFIIDNNKMAVLAFNRYQACAPRWPPHFSTEEFRQILSYVPKILRLIVE